MNKNPYRTGQRVYVRTSDGEVTGTVTEATTFERTPFDRQHYVTVDTESGQARVVVGRGAADIRPA